MARTPFKMAGFSGFGNSPLRQEKKKYKKATNKQLKPYSDIKLDYENQPFLSDTMHAETRELFTPGFVNSLGGTENEGVKMLLGNFDLKMKGKLDAD